VEGFTQDTCVLLKVSNQQLSDLQNCDFCMVFVIGKHLIPGRFSDATLRLQAGRRSTSDTTSPNGQEKHVSSTLESGYLTTGDYSSGS
jgi:hypothetical protein